MARGEGFFDDLARGLAEGSLTRGKALRLMGAAVVGGTLGSLGIGEAGADAPGCKRAGKHCTRDTQCCGSLVCVSGTCQTPATTTTETPTTTTTETPTTSTSTSTTTPTTSTSTSTTSTSTSTTSTTPMCRPDLSVCSSPSQCCGGSCQGGNCCTRSGTTVTPTTICCSRVSENGRCCSTSSEPCIINSDCCQSPLSQICING